MNVFNLSYQLLSARFNQRGVTMKRNRIFWLLTSTSALTFFFATNFPATNNVVWAQSPNAAASPSTPQSDAAITAAVQSALQKEKWLPGTDLHASTKKGVVTISGSARTHGDIPRALQLAQQTPGVVKVKSQIKVLALPKPGSMAQ
jgi:BON domain